MLAIGMLAAATALAQQPAPPPDVRALVERAQKMVRAGDLTGGRSLIADEVARTVADHRAKRADAARRLTELALGAGELHDFATVERAGHAALDAMAAGNAADPRSLAVTRFQFAQMLSGLGRPEQAISLYRQAVEDFQRLPRSESEVAAVSLDLAQAHFDAGQIGQARSIAESVYDRVPEGQPYAVQARLILAAIVAAEGNLVRSVQLNREAVRAAGGAGDRALVIYAKQELGEALSRFGAHDEALRLQQEAVGALARNDPNRLLAEVLLATAHGRSGHFEAACELLEKTLAAAAEDPRSERTATTIRLQLATTCSKTGELERAQALYEQVIRSLEASGDRGNLATAVQGSASVLFFRGRHAEARRRMERAMRLARRDLDSTTRRRSLHEQEAAHAHHHQLVSSLLSCRPRPIEADAALDRADLEGVLAFRGLVERHARKLARLRRLADRHPEVQQAFETLRRAHAEADSAAVSQQPEVAGRLEAERDRAESALLDHIRRLDPRRESGRVESLTELAARLPDHAAAIVTFRYTRYEAAVEGERQPDPVDCFAGFVIERSGAVQRVELGTAASLRAAVEHLRGALRSATNSGSRGRNPGRATERGRASGVLANAVAKLREALPETASTLFVCPDAELASIPWQALEWKTDRRIVYGEDLRALVPRPGSELNLSLLVVGGVDYGDGEQASWTNLPGTADELERVARAFASANPAADVERLTAGKATVGAFAAAASRARFLHVATHGFAGGPGDGETDRRGELTAGLVFANANALGDESILLAGDLAELDLSSCELAVLSACNTNQGARATGDAVTGLNRALRLAGARFTMTTLWEIPDDDAARFVGWFYDGLWRERRSASDAFHAAVARARRELSAAVWAGFVLYGSP